MRKYPNDRRDWGWQWVFPATRIYVDRVTGQAAAITSMTPCCSVR
jgi:hypothetical protein